VVTLKGLAVTVTHGWWESFRRRHPKLTLRTADLLSYARAMASDPETIGNYFDLLEHTLVENDLLDKPAQIFNMDETGMPLDPSPPRVVARRGQKHPSAVGSGDKSQITVLYIDGDLFDLWFPSISSHMLHLYVLYFSL